MLKVHLTESEWVIVINQLASGPYKEVNGLIQKLSEQLMAQKSNENRIAEMRSKHDDGGANKIEETSAPPKRARN